MDDLFARGIRESPGVTFVPVNLVRSLGPANLGGLLAVRRYIARSGPFDVIHGHSSIGGAVARLASVGSGARVVYTPNAIVTMDPALGGTRRRAFATLERALVRLTDVVICASPEEQRHVLELGFPPKKLAMVPHGVDLPDLPTRAVARARLGLPEDGLVIGYIGRLTHQKNPELLVRAFGDVRGADPGARLVLIGDGPKRDLVERVAAELGVSDAVSFVPTREDARSFLPAFDLLGLPSLYETMPYVSLEALVAGVPIVATESSAIEMLTGDDGIAVTAPGLELGPFAEALRRLALDSSLRAAMVARSRALARRLSVANFVASTLAAYGLTPWPAGVPQTQEVGSGP